VLFAVAIGASVIHVDTNIGSFIWLGLYGRRLHDFGRSRWWAAGVLALALFPVVAGALLGDVAFRYALFHNGVDGAGRSSWIYFGVIGFAFLIQHSFTVWLGLQKGDEGENRYGRAPGTPERKSWQPSSWEPIDWEPDEPSAPTTSPAGPPLRPSVGASQFGNKARPVFGRRPSRAS
jgi:uncharacterized membrane protein YhaH (DUF805 family)